MCHNKNVTCAYPHLKTTTLHEWHITCMQCAMVARDTDCVHVTGGNAQALRCALQGIATLLRSDEQ